MGACFLLGGRCLLDNRNGGNILDPNLFLLTSGAGCHIRSWKPQGMSKSGPLLARSTTLSYKPTAQLC